MGWLRGEFFYYASKNIRSYLNDVAEDCASKIMSDTHSISQKNSAAVPMGRDPIVVIFWCLLPLLAALPSPGAMARSRALRVCVHLASAAVFIATLIYATGAVRRAWSAAAIFGLAEYWIFVRMERSFEKRYGRAPKLTMGSPGDFNWEDRRISLIWWLVCCAAMLSSGLILEQT